MSSNPTTRVAIVTGGAQGIGRAIALRLAADGLDVAIDDLPSKSALLDEIVKEIQKLGRKAVAFTLDVTKEGDVKALVERTVAELGRLDVMVANAGISGKFKPIIEADLSAWKEVWDVNVTGALFCYKYGALQMIKQASGGRILGASSICGKQGFAGLAPYCTSKAMIRSLTQTASIELAQHKITVNAYAPGLIQTEMTANESDAELGGHGEALRLAMRLQHAKLGQPEVVASLVSYLASDEAHFISGQTISADGGLRFD